MDYRYLCTYLLTYLLFLFNLKKFKKWKAEKSGYKSSMHDRVNFIQITLLGKEAHTVYRNIMKSWITFISHFWVLQVNSGLLLDSFPVPYALCTAQSLAVIRSGRAALNWKPVISLTCTLSSPGAKPSAPVNHREPVSCPSHTLQSKASSQVHTHTHPYRVHVYKVMYLQPEWLHDISPQKDWQALVWWSGLD